MNVLWILCIKVTSGFNILKDVGEQLKVGSGHRVAATKIWVLDIGRQEWKAGVLLCYVSMRKSTSTEMVFQMDIKIVEFSSAQSFQVQKM